MNVYCDDILIHCERIPPIQLTSTSMTSCVYLVRTFTFYSLSIFQLYSRVFPTTLTTLYILRPYYFKAENLYLLTKFSLFPPPLKPLANTFLFSVSMSLAFYSDYTYKWSDQIRSDQSLSRIRLFATPWITALQASLSITNPRSSLRLTSVESVIPSSHLILWRPLLLLPPIPPSISLFQWVNCSHKVAKVLEFQL